VQGESSLRSVPCPLTPAVRPPLRFMMLKFPLARAPAAQPPAPAARPVQVPDRKRERQIIVSVYTRPVAETIARMPPRFRPTRFSFWVQPISALLFAVLSPACPSRNVILEPRQTRHTRLAPLLSRRDSVGVLKQLPRALVAGRAAASRRIGFVKVRSTFTS
jgi:hypothetical protein